MKLSTVVSGISLLALSTFSTSSVLAQDIKTRLNGYEETPLTINTNGSGEFNAKIIKQKGVPVAIDYELTYRDLSSALQQAHIHFGRPAISGMIILFLCTNLTPPAGVPTPPSCPASPGKVTGTLTAADVIARSAQGIDGGAAGFAEIIEAMRAGAAYANVHTATFPSGEIRGRLPGEGSDAQ